MSKQTFSLSVGDIIERDDGDGLRVYRVETVNQHGAVMAVNVKTGLKRSFDGYGRVVRPDDIVPFCPTHAVMLVVHTDGGLICPRHTDAKQAYR